MRYLEHIFDLTGFWSEGIEHLSTILGALQVYAVSSMIKFGANIKLLSNSVSLNTLKLWHVTTLGTLDFELSKSKTAAVVIWFALIHVPSALCTGSIMPVVATADVQSSYQIPDYSQEASSYWGNLCPPATPCIDRILGNTSDLATFPYAAWRSE